MVFHILRHFLAEWAIWAGSALLVPWPCTLHDDRHHGNEGPQNILMKFIPMASKKRLTSLKQDLDGVKEAKSFKLLQHFLKESIPIVFLFEI